ncbi:MAG: hypothetical protein EOP46_00205 [Sphingobacteriaceae bacterium]|nr:MAG: hypothetical protein EOP46_00205 [Sphingobacteriaceae bacterium]
MQKYIFICFTLLTSFAFCQDKPGLKGYITAINKQREKLPVEKLYVQTDKPYYIAGDTLRFKAYLLNGDFLTPSVRSGLLYVQLTNTDAQQLDKRQLVPVVAGISWGEIILDGSFSQGSYVLRAYTNWMRNFGGDYIFTKDISVSAVGGSSVWVNPVFSWAKAEKPNKSRVDAVLQFADTAYNPWRLKDLKLRVMNGKRGLFQASANTGVDGKASLSFQLADETQLDNLNIYAQQTGSNADTAVLRIPVIINRPENTDVQFLAEGGSLLAGILTKIGLKAIGEDGKGVAVTGRVVNSKQKEIVSFASAYAGMGSFELRPEAGESYTAEVKIGKLIKNYPMPAVNTAGTALKVTQSADSVAITVYGNNAGGNTPMPDTAFYYLIAQARGIVCYGQSMALNNARLTQTIAKNLFPTGICRFTLLDADGRPLNERQIFIDNHDYLNIDISPHKQYTTRDNISLQLAVKNKDGQPVQGNFSLSVTDDSQARLDSLGDNIISNLLLSSDIKGVVENPGYYFTNPDGKTMAALDNLLLTQGWVGYSWNNIFGTGQNPGQPVYKPEKEFVVTGKVTNVFGKGVEGSKVVLFSKKPLAVQDTVTDKNGMFSFKGLFPVDTAMIQLTARNKNGKDNVGIEILNEFVPPVFKARPQTVPWYVNAYPEIINNVVSKAKQVNTEMELSGQGKRLNEVVIKGKKVVRNSKHVAEPDDYDQVFDEQDMLNARKMSLTQFLLAKVKGFQITGLASTCITCPRKLNSFVVDSKPVYFVVDGISLNQLWNGNPYGPFEERDRYNFLKPYTDFFNAEDITGIEVMKSVSQIQRYTSHYVQLGPDYKPFMGFAPFTFIEITTRSGHGPFLGKSSGSYMYRPIAFTLAKQFYSPKYTPQNKTKGMGADLRSTIYWHPNVVTDSDGKAAVSFFSADKPGTYSIITEGVTATGQLGYSIQSIKITAAQ